MKILGISCGFHDAAASVIEDGEILFAGHAERYSKVKHDSKLNNGLLVNAMGVGGLPDVVSYYENPWLKKTRQLYSGQYKDFFNVEDLNLKRMLEKQTGLHYDFVKEWNYHSHHLSHAAAGFQTSPFDDATVVVIDAIGEWDCITIWDAIYDKDGKACYKRTWGAKYPNSVGLYYSAMTQKVGLRPLDEEYILMGMAAYGQPIYNRELLEKFWKIGGPEILRARENLHLGTDWHSGPPWTSQDDDMVEQDQYDIAASAQVTLEQVVGYIMNFARRVGKSPNLVYMGGVALNCVCNTAVARIWEDVWIMPNPGDAGSSLGAAALTYGKKLNWQGPFLGHNIIGDYPDGEILKELMSSRQIVGVANGRAEFGPRALGNRTLFADPRGDHIKDKVNEIKRRQQFRPFAPMILEEKAEEYFDMPLVTEAVPPDTRPSFSVHKQGVPRHFSMTEIPSPFMQYVGRCKQPNKFPAIVHKDGTSRVQTVGPNDNPDVRNLLKLWEYYTGCPMLLNTSLNIRGEPMVNDVSDARRFEKLYNVKVCT
jgi:carbamoyltransferase